MPFLIAAIYLVNFWDFFTSLLPLPASAQIILTQVPEMAIYSGIILMQGSYLLSTGRIRIIGCGIDATFFLFLTWAAFSTVIATSFSANGSNAIVSILNIKALVRYVFLFYLVGLINWDEYKYRSVVRAFLFCFLLQAAIGCIQMVVGQPALDFFSPRSIQSTLGLDRIAINDRERFEVEIFGTFRNTISFAYVMMVGAIIIMIREIRIGPFTPTVILALVAAIIYLSGSRIVFLLLLGLLVLRLTGIEVTWRNTKKWFIIGPLAFLALLSAYLFVLRLDLDIDRTSMAFIFSPEYLESAMNQRLGILTRILPSVVFRPEIIFGLGADKSYIVDFVADSLLIDNYALLANLQYTFEDVYWISLLFYFGLPGIFLWTLFLAQNFLVVSHVSVSHDGWISESARISKVLLILLIPLNFINQAFEVQSFAISLWTFTSIAVKSHLGSYKDGATDKTRTDDHSQSNFTSMKAALSDRQPNWPKDN